MYTARVLMLVGLLWARPAIGQVLVYDALAHVNTTLISFQTTISAVQSVLQTGYMIVELTGIESAIGGAEFMATLAQMHALLMDANAIGADFRSIAVQVDRLFSPTGAVASSKVYAEWKRQADTELYAMWRYATQVQSLVATILHTIEHFKQFWDRIGVLIGNRQALQSINEQTTKIAAAQDKQIMMNGAFQRAEAYERLAGPKEREFVRLINDEIMADWPVASN